MKKLRIVLLLVVIAIGCAFSPLLISKDLSHEPPDPPKTKTHSPKAAKQPATHYGLPLRIKIPKLKVDAAIDSIGLTPEGYMQAPPNLQTAGWYKFGPYPGNKGSAVIAGHYSLSKDIPVFNKLYTLTKGDIVQVTDENGVISTFVVDELKTYDKNAAAPEVFSSSDGKAHLNLITCSGTWQKSQQSYSERLVVFADIK